MIKLTIDQNILKYNVKRQIFLSAPRPESLKYVMIYILQSPASALPFGLRLLAELMFSAISAGQTGLGGQIGRHDGLDRLV